MSEYQITWSDQVANDFAQIKSFLKKVDYQDSAAFIKDLIHDITDQINNHLSEYPVSQIISGKQVRKFSCHHFVVLIVGQGQKIEVLRLLNKD